MDKLLFRRLGGVSAVLVLAVPGAPTARAAPDQTRVSAVTGSCTVPAPPADLELNANADVSITVSWSASGGATGYNIYRGIKPGGERKTPITSTEGTSYRDRHLSTKPVYFYKVTAVNSCGESARSAEEASKTPPPIGTGGSTTGVRSGRGWVYYCKDALLARFDWFERLSGWFPQVLASRGAIAPGQAVVDMAYSERGTMTFKNVVVPRGGLYTVDWRYAFDFGAFPGVRNRQMGLEVDGKVIATTERFPMTGSFRTYKHSFLQVRLHKGKNAIVLFAVSHHGVPRLDEMRITPAAASVPSAPANLTVTGGSARATLRWAASSSGHPTAYTIYRGTKSDGEANTPVGTVSGTTTTFTDTGLRNGTRYFYNVAASNRVGVSPDSNEVSVTPRVPAPRVVARDSRAKTNCATASCGRGCRRTGDLQSHAVATRRVPELISVAGHSGMNLGIHRGERGSRPRWMPDYTPDFPAVLPNPSARPSRAARWIAESIARGTAARQRTAWEPAVVRPSAEGTAWPGCCCYGDSVG